MAAENRPFADTWRELQERSLQRTHPWRYLAIGAVEEPIPFDSPLPLFPPGLPNMDNEKELPWLICCVVSARLFDLSGPDDSYLERVRSAPEPWWVMMSTFEVDGQIQNGGIAQMLDNVPHVIEHAVAGFRALGLFPVAEILREAQRADLGHEESLTDRPFSRLARNMLGMSKSVDLEEDLDDRLDALTDQYMLHCDEIQAHWDSYIRANITSYTTSQWTGYHV